MKIKLTTLLIVLILLVIGGFGIYFLSKDKNVGVMKKNKNDDGIVFNNKAEENTISNSEIEKNQISNSTTQENLKVETTNNNEKQYEELDINSLIVKNAHNFIPTVSFNKFLPTAYQKSKITFNDLTNEVKLINIFNHIDFNKEEVEIMEEGVERNYNENVLGYWFSFNPEIMHKYAKEFYGSIAYIKDEDFDIIWGAGCYYNNGIYSYSYGGSGTILEPITFVTKAYTDGENLYIYDKFLEVREVVLTNDLNENEKYEFYIYNNTISEPIDKIFDEKIYELESDDFNEYFMNKYKDKMSEYKHTYRINEKGEYYWVSTEYIK